MSALNENMSKTIGSISAINTLLQNYPVFSSFGNLTNGNTSFSFMLKILEIIGVDQSKIIRWVAKLYLKGKVLNVIEESVKAVLIANCSKLFTCSLNPLLPDELMRYYDDYKNPNGGKKLGKGITLNLDVIDLYGILNNCPVSDDGSLFYFDSKELLTDETKTESYTTEELWKSCDFNAYLWYVINKGTGVGHLQNRNYWDNRAKYIKLFTENKQLKEKFFDGNLITAEESKKNKDEKTNEAYNKKQILYCEYAERYSKSIPNALHIWLNSERYYHTTNISGKTKILKLNKTIFEFNIDYVNSLKLFDPKTLIANVVNAIFGLTSTLNYNYTFVHSVIAGQMGSIIEKVMESEDTEVDNCYFSFSNEDYDRLLQEAIKKHNGTLNQEQNSVDYSSLYNSINDINNSATLHEQETKITNILTDVVAVAAKNGSESESDKFNVGLGIINNVLKETVTQITMQVFSPKVMILFKINQIVAGDIDPDSDMWKQSPKTFAKNFQNVIIATIKETLKIIYNQMYAFLYQQLKPLITLFSSKVLLESLKDYRTMLQNIITECKSISFNFGKNSNADTIIDNVNYADIIPSKTTPNKKC